MCKISVVIPVYNSEDVVDRAISSILAQTFADFELLLINDGSTDRGGELCRAAAAHDGRIRYIEKENGGLASVRNRGMDEAQGEYICFIDSDDYLDPGALAFMLQKAEKTHVDIVLCGYMMENGGAVSQIAAASCLIGPDSIGKHIVELKSKNLIDTAWNKLYRADFLASCAVRFPEGEIFEDTDFNLRLLAYKPLIAVCSECFYHYILHMGSITRHYNPEKLETIKRRARLLKEVTDGVDDYCDYYFIKSVFSALIDLFMSFKREEIRQRIAAEIHTDEFRAAAQNAAAPGKRSQMIISAARSGSVRRVYRFCRLSYVLKYKMQKLFLRVRQ